MIVDNLPDKKYGSLSIVIFKHNSPASIEPNSDLIFTVATFPLFLSSFVVTSFFESFHLSQGLENKAVLFSNPCGVLTLVI